ncbi:MAG: hypothetical protein ETSY1_01945 [Candidatus Entotheonella factor]|uniref:Phenolphthiocerol/phthiocerol polyketide synthase subunit E n=1 Tax=Entotheonella factor TaxID=1429438 RepID=W4LYT2_ENTF1|nr:MAG: hypothetical protein ETSY1_01945 [Candidatus Entotheonella factor]
MSELEDKLASLSSEQRALFELRLKRLQQQQKKEPPRIVRRHLTEPCPLSLDQERLWFMNQVNPDNAAYNIHMASRYIGELDIGILERSLNEVVKRHDVLRTTFVSQNGKPRQVITPELTISLPLVDLQHLTPEEQNARADAYAIEQSRLAFDLENGPLIRQLLLKMSPAEHVHIIVQHHIITDWWSSQSVLEEMTTCYDAFVKGVAPVLPEPFQYTDFVMWEQERLQQRDMDASLAYWRKHLAGGTFELDLPFAKRRPKVQTDAGQYQLIHFSPELVTALRELSKRENVTLFMMFTAVINLILFRYSQQTDITLGTPLANRSQPELESILGFLITMLVLHTEMSGDLSFKDLLKRVRQVILEAYAHQDVPFAKLLEVTQLPRDWGRNPLFQYSFIFLSDEGAATGFESLEMIPIEYDPHVSRFDMTFVVGDHGDYIDGFIEYNIDLFSEASMARFGAHFETLLQSLTAYPDMPIGALPMLTQAEQEQILFEWNDTAAQVPVSALMHELFEQHAVRTPDAVAIVFDTLTDADAHPVSLTYRALNARANQLAYHLQDLGVGPEVMVGLCAERAPDLVIGLLAILKAGGAFVPLDPDYPPERLAFMLTDAQLSLVVSEAKLLDRLPEGRHRVVCLDLEREIMAQKPVANPATPLDLDHLAYVIYTSGSTGRPKGTLVTHRGIGNLSQAQIRAFEIKPQSRVLQVASLNFDASVWEVAMALCAGASLYLAPPSDLLPGLPLHQCLQTHAITHVTLVPSAAGAVSAEDLPDLQTLIVAGEACPADLVRRWSPGRQFVNAYGPTETTVCATMMDCRGLSSSGDLLTPPIGRPIDHFHIYLLDPHLQPVPIGVPGELHIGGIGLARGYLKQPALTAEKFIVNPFGEGRLYKSGDLARYLPDGSIEFLGRMDQQVKLRGFRIELGEIEAILNRHPAVRETAVVLREEASGRQRLVTYVVTEDQPQVFSRLIPDFRSHLQHMLPDYMVPAAFVPLTSLPLTPNGKVDRRALPDPDTAAFAPTTEFALPQTPAEQTLAAIWAEFLNVEQVGRHDNFFELGGDSILSLQIISRANQAGLYLTPGQLFEHQTVAGLAAAAHAVSQVQAEQGLVTGPLPLTPIQQWFFAHEHANVHHFNQDVLLDVAPTTEPQWLQQAVQALLSHHDALRLRFTQDENGWQQTNAGITEASPFSFHHLSDLPPDEQLATLEETRTALHAAVNISEGPLLQVALFALGPDTPAKLLFIVHHLAVDYVSWRVLLEDLWTAYGQLERDEAVRLPAKTTSFKAWSEWLSVYAQSGDLVAEQAYWLALGDAQVMPLPVDYPANRTTGNTTSSAAEVACVLSADDTRLLLQSAPAVYHTQINDLLLTALAQSFTQWTGANHVLIGLEGHGREELSETLDLSRTVGWFTSLFPILLTCGAAPAHLGETIKSIKEQLRQVPNRGVGYGLLRYLNPDTTPLLAQLPEAEVSFNYAGQFQDLQSESIGGSSSQDGQLDFLVSVDAFVVEDRLQVIWAYSENLYQRATMERLAQDFIAALQALIAHCQLPEAGGYTPSDFPLIALEQPQLDRLLGNGRTVEDVYPLSPLQAGMLFHSLYAPGSGVYVTQFTFQLEGDVDIAALKRAWQQMIARHSILRTAFHWSGLAQPIQLVQRTVELPWEEVDWQHLSEEEQALQLDVWLAAERAKGFDLTQAPLMRCTLMQLGHQCYQFVWNFHHLLLDGWSWPILFHELFTLYETGEMQLPAPRPYRDYIAWIAQQDMAEAEAFWRQTLQGFTAPTPLSAVSPRSQGMDQDGPYLTHTFHLSSQLSRDLEGMARQHRLTLNTLVQGAWALLLSRYSGESEVVFGVTVSGRPASLSGVEEMVGMFINTLPLRVRLPREHGLIAWLRGLQTQQVTQEQYAYTPLVEIQGWSEIPPGMPLFDSFVVFENYPIDDAAEELPGAVRLSHFDGVEEANYPLTLIIAPETEFRAEVHYDSSRFDEAAIIRVGDHLQRLLEAMAADSSQDIRFLPLLTEVEQQQILFDWNDTASTVPVETLMHQLFEQQVVRTPDAAAIVFDTLTDPLACPATLTYRALNEHANQLAHHLQDLGVGPEVMVGLGAERAPDLVIGLLAILKAGGAYVPLDPDYPPERLAFMLADAQLPIVVTEAKLLDRLPEGNHRVVCLDLEREVIAQQPTSNPVTPLHPEHLAYVIYTSGSTGRPKGTLVTHRGIGNLAQAQIRVFGIEPQSRVLQVASLNFDASISEIAITLCAGATLYLAPAADLLPGPPLQQCLQTHAMTHVTLVPSAAATISADDLTDLQTLIVAGEACPADLMRHWAPGRRFVNAYGPTESTVCAAMMDCRGLASSGDLLTPPIGRPIDHLHIYLLDPHLQPVPIGVPGELHIGGIGLARGYLRQPALTAEKFIVNPFGEGRLYKSGDLARYLPDGTIEFLGRMDQQVKLRGFRIELGEIEAVLSRQPTVQAAAAVVRESEAGLQQLVAYVVPDGQDTDIEAVLRRHLRAILPDYMVPEVFVWLEQLPLNPNGKVDRQVLPAPAGETVKTQAGVQPQSRLERDIAGIWQDVLNLEPVGVEDNFFDLGGHSLLMLRVHDRLQQTVAPQVTMVELFQYPTIALLARHLGQASSLPDGAAHVPVRRAAELDDIAIISLNGRFPGAKDAGQFWYNLRDGVEGIVHFSDDELLQAGLDPAWLRDPNYVKANGVLDDIDLFDALFFGFNPREATMLNPQLRLFLECAWEILEKAGYNPDRYAGLIGVYAGCGANDYVSLAGHGIDPADEYQLHLGNDNDFLTTQVTYKLNLKGPGITVQTACSTSLVAVHLACQALLSRECDMALAGGVTVQVPQQTGYLYQPEGILSPDGHCRAFDANAAGTLGGSGVGIVMLKRLGDAMADGDSVLAVIKASAINNDGAMKVGFTAPSIEGQVGVISKALTLANINPETISYIEAHGTGTALGDPIEIAALTQAFRRHTDKTGYCKIGAVKSNVGHLDAAAGIVGLIKTVLALQHRLLPPSLHFETPNPQIDFATSPFRVNTELTEWTANDHPRRAGVSSFGIGGTNAHVIVEEAPAMEPSGPSRPWQLLLLSARTASALDQATSNLAGYLRDHPQVKFADVAYTLQVGRRTFDHRRILLCPNPDTEPHALGDIITVLDTLDPTRLLSTQERAKERAVVFLFPGQGTQYINMARELYDTEPVFQQVVDTCAEQLQADLALDLRDLIYPSADDAEPAAERLNQTAYSQPALFVIEYALARLWMSWGIQPQAMIGHSLGEYVAACVAGVFSLTDALKLVAVRGRLMQDLPGGSMLAVSRPAAEIEPLLGEKLSLAAVNSPLQCVVSGEPAAIEVFARQLANRHIACQRLHTSHAFHSAMMEPMLAPFAEHIQHTALQPPSVPFISNVTGTWITSAEAADPAYWVRHVRQPVRFADGLQPILAEPDWLLLEMGPGLTLSGLIRQQGPASPAQTVLTSLPAASVAAQQSALPFVLTTLGRLWLAGAAIDWDGFYAQETRHRIPLPAYPFERQRYWPEALAQPGRGASGSHAAVSLPSRKNPNLAEWFYVPSWKRAVTPKVAALTETQTWLVFVDPDGVGEQLLNHLHTTAQVAVAVTAGTEFARIADDRYTLDPQAPADYEALLNALRSEAKFPRHICHFWNVSRPVAAVSDQLGAMPLETWLDRVDRARATGFDSLLGLAQALGAYTLSQPINLAIITSQLYQVAGDEQLAPEKASIMGPCRVIPQEYPDIHCLNIDLPEPSQLTPVQIEPLIRQLIAELTDPRPEAADSAQVIAYRGPHRWLQTYDAAHLALSATNGAGLPVLLRQGGTYLITGGLGGIGLTLANDLARRVRANLILLSRSALKENNQQAVQALEALGSDVLVMSADVADERQMANVIAQARERFGHIHGVIHAAGIPGGGIIQLKTPDAADAVLRPKVQGTLVLDTLLHETPPDFMVYCSSLASIVGSFGQVDYCAANAFQDAFAHYRTTHPTHPVPITALNWDAWQEVGIAAVQAVSRPVAHPLFEQCLVEAPNRLIYVSKLNVGNHWVLHEHRIRGQATLPGTVYTELARAAFAERTGVTHPVIDIRDVALQQPLVVADDEDKEVRTLLTDEGEQVAFSVVSRLGDAWLEHARGVIRANGTASAPHDDLDVLEAQCPQAFELPEPGSSPEADGPALVTGPRFNTLQHMQTGDNCGLACLELPEEFASDLESYLLHPTMLDAATAFLTLPTVSEAVPIGYRRMTIFGSLPGKIYSYARYTEAPQSDILTLDVTIMDEQGQVRVAIEAFTLMQIGLETLVRDTEAVAGDAAQNGSAIRDEAPRGPAHGIKPREGQEVLSHILNHRLPQVLISTMALDAQRELVRTLAQPDEPEPPVSGRHHRPALNSPYVAPATEAEHHIAQVWEDLLGIEQIGIHDDFFELGGHSLLATRLVAELQARFGKRIPLATLFQAPTIGQLAPLLSETAAAQPWSPAIAMQRGGERPAFFCIPGAGTHVFYLREFAQSLGADQPFYGLQPPGIEGDTVPLSQVEDLVALFADAMRQSQPAGPYLLGGHSAGGHIAFALAVALQAQGDVVPLLVIVDTATVKDINEESERLGTQHAQNLNDYVNILKERLGDRLSISASDLERLNEDEAADYAAEAYKEANLLPAEAGGEEVKRMDDMNKAITEALQNYEPREIYHGQLLLLQAEQGEFEDRERMIAGWQALCSKPVQVHTVPGNHMTMLMAPNVEVMARHVRRAADEVLADGE